MNTQAVALTREDYTTIMNNGGKITFKPLKRNKLKCNQIPRLTHLSKKHAETLRKQFGILRRDLAHGPQSMIFVQTATSKHRLNERRSLREFYLDGVGDVQCEECFYWHMSRKRGDIISCEGSRCSTKFIVR